VNCFSTQPIAREIILGQVGSVRSALQHFFHSISRYSSNHAKRLQKIQELESTAFLTPEFKILALVKC